MKGTCSIEDKVSFIVDLGVAFHHYGASTYRIEVALSNVSKQLGLEAQFFFTPTYIISAFKVESGEISRHIRVEPGDIALNKLCLVDQITDQVVAGEISVKKGMEALKTIAKNKNNYPPPLKILSTGIVSATISILLRPEIENAIASFIVGCVVGLTKEISLKISHRNLNTASIFEFITSFFAAILSYFICLHLSKIDFFVTLLSGLIVLIPGLSLTTAISELARNHLASGTARMMGTFVSLIKFALGVVLAVTLMKSLGVLETALPGMPVGEFLTLAFIILSGIAFTILFEAKIQDTHWIIIAGLMGVYSAKFGELLIGGDLAIFIGGLIIGTSSNAFARLLKRPASVFLIPGIILLVPGSLGYKSIYFLFERNTLAGIEAAFSMIAIALTLVAGLLLGHLLIDPKRSL